MSRRRLHGAAKLLVSLQLLVGLAPAGLSMCVAADGHTALELSHAEIPCLRDMELHHPEKTVFDADELSHHSHHACEDVPLLQPLARRLTENAKAFAPSVPIFLVPFHTASCSPRALLGVMESQRPPIEQASRALRSVILIV